MFWLAHCRFKALKDLVALHECKTHSDAAQEKLCQASVLIVGAGGLGCPAAVYLAASGIGRIGIVDHDTVELSNLHRQILHTEASVGTHKAQSAASACCAVNSSIEVDLPLATWDLDSEVYQRTMAASDLCPYAVCVLCCILVT